MILWSMLYFGFLSGASFEEIYTQIDQGQFHEAEQGLAQIDKDLVSNNALATAQHHIASAYLALRTQQPAEAASLFEVAEHLLQSIPTPNRHENFVDNLQEHLRLFWAEALLEMKAWKAAKDVLASIQANSPMSMRMKTEAEYRLGETDACVHTAHHAETRWPFLRPQWRVFALECLIDGGRLHAAAHLLALSEQEGVLGSSKLNHYALRLGAAGHSSALYAKLQQAKPSEIAFMTKAWAVLAQHKHQRGYLGAANRYYQGAAMQRRDIARPRLLALLNEGREEIAIQQSITQSPELKRYIRLLAMAQQGQKERAQRMLTDIDYRALNNTEQRIRRWADTVD